MLSEKSKSRLNEFKEIFETNDLKYPLNKAQFIKDIKYGKYHYKNNGIGEKLNTLLDEINELADKSNLPESVNSKELKKLILMNY